MAKSNVLTKNSYTAYAPGSPGVPAFPGRPFIPAYCTAVYVDVVQTTMGAGGTWEFHPVTAGPLGANEVSGVGSYNSGGRGVYPVVVNGILQGYMVNTGATYSSFTTRQLVGEVCYPSQPALPPTPAIPAVPSQFVVEKNLGWNSAARSVAVMAGSGEMKFTVDPGVNGIVVGMNDVDMGTSFLDMENSWYITNSIARVYENGVEKFYSGPISVPTVFGFRRINGVVQYLRGGSVVYTSATTNNATVFMDVSLYSGGDYVYDPSITPLAMSQNSMLPIRSVGYKGAYRFAYNSLQPLTGGGRQAVGGAVSLKPLIGLASDKIYGASATNMGYFTAFGQGGLPVPAYANSDNALYALVGMAVGTTGIIGGGVTTMAPAMGAASDHRYGASSIRLPALTGVAGGTEGNFQASIHSLIAAYDYWSAPWAVYAVMSNDMTVATLVAVDKINDAVILGSANFDDNYAVQEILGAVMTSLATLGLVVPVTDDVNVVYVVSEKGQTSRYEQFDFNSFAKIDGKYYGVKSDGLYLLEGDSDEGFNIAASIGLGVQNFGTSALKRVANTYLGVSSTGTMFLKVTVENQEYIYAARRDDATLKTQRVDIGKGLRANYFQFDLYNSDGADFELASVEFAAVTLDRRI